MKMFFILLLWLSGGCASDRPPAGGAPDTSPLQVLSSNPAPSSINVSTDRIHLTFNHYISARQLLNSLLFSPSIGKYDIAVNGKEVDVRVFNPLEKNRTYHITLDKNLRDTQGHTFPGPYTFAFSTGPSIDTGVISGKVVNADFSPATNALLLAFSEQSNTPAEASLLTREPDYLIQADASGVFSFNNIGKGFYKIFAVNNRNNDLRYTYKTEEVGLSSASLVPAGSSNLMFRLDGLQSKSDGIVSCSPLEEQRLEITFGRPINITSFNPEKLEIRHAESHTLIPAVTWFSKNRSLYERTFLIVTAKLQPSEPYLISYRGDDGTGTIRTIPFYGSSQPKVNHPLSITIAPDNGSNPAYLDLAWPALGKAVVIRLSDPRTETELSHATTLSERASGAESNLRFSLIKIDPRTFALKPANGFQPGRSYSVSVNPADLTSTTDKSDKLKPVVSQFRTAENKECGSISGTGHASGKYAVIEAKLSGSASTFSMTALCDKNGTFRYLFPELPPGSYTVSAFIPSGSRPPGAYQQWNPGSIEPYRPAEAFGFFAEPVKVRAGWTTQHIDIQIITSR